MSHMDMDRTPNGTANHDDAFADDKPYESQAMKEVWPQLCLALILSCSTRTGAAETSAASIWLLCNNMGSLVANDRDGLLMPCLAVLRQGAGATECHALAATVQAAGEACLPALQSPSHACCRRRWWGKGEASHPLISGQQLSSAAFHATTSICITCFVSQPRQCSGPFQTPPSICNSCSLGSHDQSTIESCRRRRWWGG